ncbi:MAG: hypothetical protein NVS2B12_27120 [Ktedonobacteraceae bacterium]
MPTEERNKAIIRQMYEELFTQGKLSLAEEMFAADYIDQEAPPGLPNRGPESMRQLVTMFHKAFPDVSFRVEEVIAEDETVAARVTWTGTHHGSFLGIAPTGRAVQQKQMHFMRFINGQIVEHLALRDDLGLRQQLGTIAAPADKP